ncbi:hypothetical protein DL766_005156 [Monosporascus sp. MC13-8B]|uniref:Xylanolytic transcriptional activator regulatory domain-containing protein n=1 Tax=Monosporascus cannonballus TaxID=155416 RepID=A0ABY0HIN1_9PEZI|nr:hypothetical protein DL763_005684 [Monosporascus cannonballus]RYO94304.1 hypothetical protein DL762_000628 [Monosporascus cannonballus]RYP29857.1 hypothetical protein DL766_005156 [Monosporascus sp. MC13-8B]
METGSRRKNERDPKKGCVQEARRYTLHDRGRPSFMKMLNEFYTCPSRKLGVEWAAINVVLANGYIVRSIAGDDIALDFDDSKVSKCIANARKQVDAATSRNHDLLGIQVLLGLAVLHQGTSDLQLSSIWVGSALRLAHRMQLHTKSSLSDFSPDVARQRTNVFWIAYFLDKDLSLRLRTPSLQLDSDVDLDLPRADPDELDGSIQSFDGLSRFNYFRARVLLAHVSGRIYDELFSHRSKKLSPQTREQRVIRLDRILDQWQRSIPAPLHPEHLGQTLGMVSGSLMVVLHHTYLLCLITLHGVYSLESPWIKKLGGFTNMVLQHADNNSEVCRKHQTPPLPSAWAKIVSTTRGCLQLYISDLNGASKVWPDACSNFTAFVVLLANIVYHPLHELVEHDRRLVRDAIKRREKQLDFDGLEWFRKLKVILASLERLVEVTVNFARTNGVYDLPPGVAPAPDKPYPAIQLEGFVADDIEHAFQLHLDISRQLRPVPVPISLWKSGDPGVVLRPMRTNPAQGASCTITLASFTADDAECGNTDHQSPAEIVQLMYEAMTVKIRDH